MLKKMFLVYLVSKKKNESLLFVSLLYTDYLSAQPLSSF